MAASAPPPNVAAGWVETQKRYVSLYVAYSVMERNLLFMEKCHHDLIASWQVSRKACFTRCLVVGCFFSIFVGVSSKGRLVLHSYCLRFAKSNTWLVKHQLFHCVFTLCQKSVGFLTVSVMETTYRWDAHGPQFKNPAATRKPHKKGIRKEPAFFHNFRLGVCRRLLHPVVSTSHLMQFPKIDFRWMVIVTSFAAGLTFL